MSDNSRDNVSEGSHRSLIGRRQAKGFQADELKKSLERVTGRAKSVGNVLQNVFSPKSEGSVYSKGLRELDNGYEKYNLEDDGGEIFISRVPDKAMFNDGEPILVHATPDVFLSTSESRNSAPEPVVQNAQPETDINSLFVNVPRGTVSEVEFHATVGKITEDGTIEPTPINDAFLKKMVHSSNERPAPRMILEDEAPEEHMFLQIDDEVAEVPEAAEVSEESAVTKPSNSFLEKMARPSNRDFIIEPEDAEEATEDIEDSADSSEDADDYSWIEVPGGFNVDETEIPVEAGIEAPVEETVEETMEAQVGLEEDVQEDTEFHAEPEVEIPVIGITEEPSVEFEEVCIVASVEEIAADVAEDVQEDMEFHAEPEVEIPVIGITEEPSVEAEEICIEAPVEEIVADVAEETMEVPVEPVEEIVAEASAEPVAVMALPKIDIGEPEGVTGLTVEGAEPSSESEVATEVAVCHSEEAALTGATVDAPKAPASRYNGLSEDGEALPPMSDPVVRRPRSMRFRFSNGVLQNVDSEKTESAEGLRDPLE